MWQENQSLTLGTAFGDGRRSRPIDPVQGPASATWTQRRSASVPGLQRTTGIALCRGLPLRIAGAQGTAAPGTASRCFLNQANAKVRVKVPVDSRAVLNGEKKTVPEHGVFKNDRMVGGNGRLAAGGDCRLAVGGWWLAAVGGSWQLVMGGWWRLAAVDSWCLVTVGGWRLAVGGSWRLAVGGPLGP